MDCLGWLQLSDRIFVIFRCIDPQWIQNSSKDIYGSSRVLILTLKLCLWKLSVCFVSEVSVMVKNRCGWQSEHYCGVFGTRSCGEISSLVFSSCPCHPVDMNLRSWYHQSSQLYGAWSYFCRSSTPQPLIKGVCVCQCTYHRITLLFKGKIFLSLICEKFLRSMVYCIVHLKIMGNYFCLCACVCMCVCACMPACMCVSVCIHVFICRYMSVYVCARTYGSKRSGSVLFLMASVTLHFETRPLSDLGFTQSDWLATKPQGSACLCLHSRWVPVCSPHGLRYRGSDSDSHARGKNFPGVALGPAL